jgi:UDP-3-O-[3-hydroxymyristoyl] glucosamine N-acyltransferase
MKLDKPYRLDEICKLISCEFVGDASHEITGINEIHSVEEGDLVFVDHPKYYDKALKSNATTILINKDVECPSGKALILTDNPFGAYNFLCQYFSPNYLWDSEQHPSLKVGKHTMISPGVKIGRGVEIGENCIIYPGVVIYGNTKIGNGVIIHANSVIGSDAFYYKRTPEVFYKMHTCGATVIGDDVEIGSLCSVDRGVSGKTEIGNGTKLDNQVHVGHETKIGKRCLIAAQVGIAGCVTIEDEVTLWGQVGIPSDLTIGKGAEVLGQSGLMHSVEGGKKYFGSPAKEARQIYREMVVLNKIIKDNS